MKNKKAGFTLIELIVVIAVLAILSLILVPSVSRAINEARMSADKATLRSLNNITTLYAIQKTKFSNDVFSGLSDDEKRMERLISNGYLNQEIEPQQKKADFQWNVNEQAWRLYVNNNLVPLTPLGDSFEEITTGMVAKITERYDKKGTYGSDWGDHMFTDVGLDSKDWQEPINHLKYRPSKSNVIVTTENGYNIKVKNPQGNPVTVYHGWNLIYDMINEKWYSHSIKPENEVLIDEMEVVKK